MITTAAPTASLIDPLRDPIPEEWDAFATRHRLRPGWFSGPIQAVNWCVQLPSSMVMMTGTDGDPLALFHARHFGPGHPGRFVVPGRYPRLAFTECRTVPVPMEAGFTFAEGTDEPAQVELLRQFERTIRQRTGPGHLGILYRNLIDQHLPLVAGAGRRIRRLTPRMVLDNQWTDLDSYLRSLPAKWRSQLKKIRHEVDHDPDLTVEVTDQIDPDEACWLGEVTRQRYTPRFPPMPLLSAGAIAQVAQVPGSRFLTYRERDGRLVGYTALFDTGEEITLTWWGSRAITEGRRDNLYFDQYLRGIELMIKLGRSRLNMGPAMEKIKLRYGAYPVDRWDVFAPTGTRPDGRDRRRPPTAARPVPSSVTDASAVLPPAAADGGGRWRRALQRKLGRDPQREQLALECHQCGRWESVSLLRLRPTWARYWCEHCGALVQLHGRESLAGLQPREQRRAAAAAASSQSGPSTKSSTAPELEEIMLPAMVRWLHARYRRAAPADPYEKAVVYQRYREWDAHLRKLGPEAAAALATDGEPPVHPGLPPFPQVVAALHDSCYDLDRVTRQFLEADKELPELAVRQRVIHARRWLARYARSLCWVDRHPPGKLVEPDRAEVEAALAALRSGELPAPEFRHAARTALLGTDGGPSVAVLLRTHPVDEVVQALTAYLTNGARPLREAVLHRLATDAFADQPDNR